jgi:hypothetical protein
VDAGAYENWPGNPKGPIDLEIAKADRLAALKAAAESQRVPSNPDEGEEEEDEEPPIEQDRVAEEVRPGETVLAQRWGKDLSSRERLSPGFRFALYRGTDLLYRLVEMVWEEGRWRERVVFGPDAYDVVEARLMDLAVEHMSP